MTNALIAIAVVVFVVFRQVRPQPVRQQSAARLIAILGVVGIVEVAQAAGKVSTTAATAGIAVVALSLAIAAAFGVARAMTLRLWRGADGVAMQKGRAATVALWVAAMALHLGLDAAVSGIKGAGTVTGASILAFVAVSLGVQREVARYRASQLPTATPAPAADRVRL